MKTRPIIFSAEMIRAILDGRKTQTRRVVKLDSRYHPKALKYTKRFGYEDGMFYPCSQLSLRVKGVKCPYGQVGDRFFVRETWQYYDWTEDGQPYICYKADNAIALCDYPEELDDEIVSVWESLSKTENYKKHGNRAADSKWRSPLHMPRWASRIDLEIKTVRVERIQDIDAGDIFQEGIEKISHDRIGPRNRFINLFDSINGKSGYGWNKNPWVWVIQFKRLESPQ